MNKITKKIVQSLMQSVDNNIEENTVDYSLLLTKKNLYEAEYKELLKRHNSSYYKGLDNKDKLEYDCEFWHMIMVNRKMVEESQCPPLSEKEVEDYINSFLYK